MLLTRISRLYWILLSCAVVVGCGPSSTQQTIASADLIVIADIQIENGQKRLFVSEVLRNRLKIAAVPKRGDQLALPYEIREREGQVLLFYQEASGNLSWRMTMPAVEKYALLAETIRNNSGDLPPPKAASPTRIIFGILVLVAFAALIFAMIWGARILDRKWLAKHPNQKHFKWGYFQAIGSILGGLLWLIHLISGFEHWLYWPAWLFQGVLMPFAGYALIKDKKRWAWMFITIFQLNLLNWTINYFYGRNRWTEFVD